MFFAPSLSGASLYIFNTIHFTGGCLSALHLPRQLRFSTFADRSTGTISGSVGPDDVPVSRDSGWLRKSVVQWKNELMWLRSEGHGLLLESSLWSGNRTDGCISGNVFCLWIKGLSVSSRRVDRVFLRTAISQGV
jgi:hypothetical protein